LYENLNFVFNFFLGGGGGKRSSERLGRITSAGWYFSKAGSYCLC
jgi:hypothetical protein